MIPSKGCWVAVTVVILGLIIFIPEVRGQQPMDMISCGDAVVTTAVSTPEFAVWGFDAKGINLDNLPSKAFDNMTYHTLGVYKAEGGKPIGPFYSKYMDPSGDFFVVEVFHVGAERDWKYLYGTGKWKGITGGGKAIPFTKGKPVTPNTNQNCTKITGTYEIKK